MAPKKKATKKKAEAVDARTVPQVADSGSAAVATREQLMRRWGEKEVLEDGEVIRIKSMGNTTAWRRIGRTEDFRQEP